MLNFAGFFFAKQTEVFKKSEHEKKIIYDNFDATV